MTPRTGPRDKCHAALKGEGPAEDVVRPRPCMRAPTTSSPRHPAVPCVTTCE